MIGAGTAYDAMRRVMNAADRLAARRERRSRRREAWMEMLPKPSRVEQQEVSAIEHIERQLLCGDLPVSERKCPECGRFFVLIDVGEFKLDSCLQCGSFWLDAGELKALTKLPEDVPAEKRMSDPSRYSCPVCGEMMREHIFLSPYELKVDKCVHGHGVYAEKGELRKALSLR